MRRVQISPGKFVTVSTAMMEKAARVAGGLSATQVSELAAVERAIRGTVLVGVRRKRSLPVTAARHSPPERREGGTAMDSLDLQVSSAALKRST